MKKLLLISVGALLLSACSSSNQISITKSRYGNGIGISLGEGVSKEDQAKIDHKRQVIRDRAQHRRFVQSMNLNQRGLKQTLPEENINANYIELKESRFVAQKPQTSKSTLASADISNKEALSMLSTKLQDETNVIEENNVVLEEAKSVTQIENQESNGWIDGDTSTLLLVILALLLSPVAVYLYEGSWTNRVTLNLILWLLCGLPGVIHALIVILGNK